mmetsp:Transcript_17004/g.28227  ORF Transcript_17004/g.28227 Transcript_17004/m.28227 type:complete len:831 (+) Transcript_17004:68-2560(+)|eukprot:CAMPEP_0119003048 /NCGR_PEP_ID=MMETSP1176-20130426/320_1 /TAXON_ID=265551 /ORGANISM="Synedropsis recta cf, Strain CCMP1620" /LENGTH=830 /DNA_ID=CAMNT_0006954607 /DNA_START=71 /DNA_END=2563 /DNA_ORIENTATION=-
MEPEQPASVNADGDIEIAAPPEVEGEMATKRFDSEDSDEGMKDKMAQSTSNASIDFEALETDPPMRETQINLGRMGTLQFNHVTSLIGMAVLWGLAGWCMADPTGALDKLLEWRAGSALHFTWLYVGTRPVFFFFIMYIAFRYGDIRLGDKDSKPEFGNMSYFTMLFAAGIAVGIFFYGVSEPLWHQSSHYYANSDARTQDEIDQFAMNQTLYHWGLAAWAGYVVVALAVGLAAYRFKLPMTLRSTLYPILGKYTWGWIGDFVDGFTIVVTVAGVCTSLGLGAMQIMAGLQRVGWVDNNLSESATNNGLIGIIWIVTLIATVSVVSGLEVGIKHLSNIAFYLGQLLLFWTFALDNTSFILNFIVQSVGYYFQYSIILTSFWTDAFGQLREGEGRAVDDQASATWWMDYWTVFYMAWWTAWSGFIGIFIARISKGRSVFEVVMYGTFIPFTYILIWFCVFGGVGLRQARQAMELKEIGLEYYNDAGKFLADGSTYCHDVPQEDLVFGVNNTVIFTNHLLGVTPVCEFNSEDSDNAWFNVLYSFSFPDDFKSGFGNFFSIVSILAVALYFVTSSDSGSLIVDHLASNGREEHHWLQRVFWAFTEGAVASALLIAGGSDSLKALQAASILAGLPFTIIMCYMMQSILIMCRKARENPDSRYLDLSDGNIEFKTPSYGGIFNIIEYIVSIGSVHPRRVELGMDLPTRKHAVGYFTNLFFPMLAFNRILNKEHPRDPKSNLALTGLYTFMFMAWIAFFISTVKSHGLMVFGWTAFLINGFVLMATKMQFRARHSIRGNLVGDLSTSLFFYPQVMVQLEEEQERLYNGGENDDKAN